MSTQKTLPQGKRRMVLERCSGILLHPTSLPGPFGMGDLGPEAYRFVDFLAAAKQSLWQILPLGHISYGNSPYMCFSAFGGNPYLISPALLVEDGLLDPADIQDPPAFPRDRVDYGEAIRYCMGPLAESFKRFREKNRTKPTRSKANKATSVASGDLHHE